MTEKIHILVVEDDADQRTLLDYTLSKEGYDISMASNGREAVDMAAAKRPDLIVMDIRMPPGMNGIEALGEILGKDKSIPVILHSAFSSYKDDFMSWAAEKYIVKSSDLNKLKEAIKEVLAKKT